jgi:hypothetical protein
MDEQGDGIAKSHIKFMTLTKTANESFCPSAIYKSHKENIVDWNNSEQCRNLETAWAAAVNRCYERNKQILVSDRPPFL